MIPNIFESIKWLWKVKVLVAQFSSVQSLSRVQLFATPWITARKASLSITNSQSSLRLTSIESVMSSSHLILCHHPLLLPSIPPRIRVFSNESTLLMRWPKYWSFSFSIIPSKEIPGLISFRMDWLDLIHSRSVSKPLLKIHLDHCPWSHTLEVATPPFSFILLSQLLFTRISALLTHYDYLV